MKVAIILALTFICAFAQETTTSGVPPFKCEGNKFLCKFKELGHHIKYHASKLGNNLKDVGTAVLSTALDQGKDLLANGAQAVLGTILEHLQKEGLVGKRDLSFFDKIREHVFKGIDMAKKAKEAVHAAFAKAVDKLTGAIANIASLKQIDNDADKEIDNAVKDFEKEGKKGFLAMASAIADKMRAIFATGMDKIKALFGKKVEERGLLGFSSLSEAWEKAKNHLSGVAGKLAETFKPHIDALKKGISALADKAKGHASTLISSAKDSFNKLKDKLGDHVDALKGHVSKLGEHAKNAVNALKEAVTSIALQAVGNAKDTLGDIVKTGKDAAGIVKDHVNDAVSGN